MINDFNDIIIISYIENYCKIFCLLNDFSFSSNIKILIFYFIQHNRNFYYIFIILFSNKVV